MDKNKKRFIIIFLSTILGVSAIFFIVNLHVSPSITKTFTLENGRCGRSETVRIGPGGHLNWRFETNDTSIGLDVYGTFQGSYSSYISGLITPYKTVYTLYNGGEYEYSGTWTPPSGNLWVIAVCNGDSDNRTVEVTLIIDYFYIDWGMYFNFNFLYLFVPIFLGLYWYYIKYSNLRNKNKVKIKTIDEKTQTKTIYCQKCGILVRNRKNCPNCGTRV